MKTALLFGATGLVGSHILEAILADPYYSRVTIAVRKPITLSHPKLTVLVGEYYHLFQNATPFVGDDVYFALGTTRKKNPEFAFYYEIDHDYPIRASTMAKENGATSVMIITAVGANPKSWMFYPKMKGEVEERIIELDYDHTHIFRPSLLLGKRRKADKRLGESLTRKIWPLLERMMKGKYEKYKAITGKEVALAMIAAAKKQEGRVNIYEWKEMKELLNDYPPSVS